MRFVLATVVLALFAGCSRNIDERSTSTAGGAIGGAAR